MKSSGLDIADDNHVKKKKNSKMELKWDFFFKVLK